MESSGRRSSPIGAETSESFPCAGRGKKRKRDTMTDKKKLTADELDELHDSGKNLTKHLDLASARRPGREIQRINVDFPKWMIRSLDHEAERLGVTRQSVIKFWISERLEAAPSKLA